MAVNPMPNISPNNPLRVVRRMEPDGQWFWDAKKKPTTIDYVMGGVGVVALFIPNGYSQAIGASILLTGWAIDSTDDGYPSYKEQEGWEYWWWNNEEWVEPR